MVSTDVTAAPFPLPNIRSSSAAPSSPPPSAPRSSGTISSSTAPSPAWSSPSCSSRTPTPGSARSRPSPSTPSASSRGRSARRSSAITATASAAKSTLIATLLLMGLATFAVALVPTYEQHRHLGRGDPDRPALHPGHRRRRRMGRLGADVDGMGAHQPFARLHRLLAAIRRALRAFPRQSRGARASARCPASSSWPGAGASRSCSASSWSASGSTSGWAFWRRRSSPSSLARAQDRAHADARGDQAPSEGDPPVRLRAHGRTGAVLHLHRLHLLLRHRHAARLARLPAHGGARRRRSCRSSRSRSSAICPTASAARTCT